MALLERNVLCLEGEWEYKNSIFNDNASVKHVLQTLDNLEENFSFYHRRVGTISELERYLKEFFSDRRQHKSFTVINFAFHGSPGVIDLGESAQQEKQVIPLLKGNTEEESAKSLIELLPNINDLNNRIIYFGSCKTFKDARTLKEFKRISGAKAVIGYSEDVDFIESSAAELLLFQKLLYYKRPGDAKNSLKSTIPGLYERLGIQFIT